MKTHYALLGLDQGASAEDVKRAFRREIARYHPDKVQHLGTEFQEIAATRAAELTEAYRILMDPDERAAYDAALHRPGAVSVSPAIHRRGTPAGARRAAASGRRAFARPGKPAPDADHHVRLRAQGDHGAAA